MQGDKRYCNKIPRNLLSNCVRLFEIEKLGTNASQTIVPATNQQNALFSTCLSVTPSLPTKLRTNWDTANIQEDTFCVNSFDILANPFTACIPCAQYHGRDQVLAESKFRKIRVTNQLNRESKRVSGRKPDRSVSALVGNEKHRVLLCEINPRMSAKKSVNLVPK